MSRPRCNERRDGVPARATNLPPIIPFGRSSSMASEGDCKPGEAKIGLFHRPARRCAGMLIAPQPRRHV
jgi:hypothetical protein